MGKRSSDHNQIEELEGLDRKIAIVTEGFTTDKFCELVLPYRDKLSEKCSDYLRIYNNNENRA